VELTFAGAAREVTGSCHLLTVGDRTIALDCGMFQGRRSESREKNETLPLPIEQLDSIVLSHAHIDHSGRLPFLVRRGYRSTIWATPATRDLCAYMLADSAHIQEKDAEFLARRKKQFTEPLYGMQDAARTIELMVAVPYERDMEVLPGITAGFVDAGHILGSASVVVTCDTEHGRRRLVFSGDVGRSGLAIIRDPKPPSDADTVILESTYGDRDHLVIDDARARLGEIVRDTARRGGKILVPAFAIGRTQELVYDLHALARAGSIPKIPIYIDSPLAVDATSVFELHPDVFDKSEELVQKVRDVFRFELVHYTRDVSESKALNTARGPMVIIAASGMAESGRILHHLSNHASNPANTILIVGFQAEHTLGRRIVERKDTIKVFGEEIPLRARVEILNGYSAHADRRELRDWLLKVRETSPRLRQIFLVHGESPAQEALASQLRSDGFSVSIPARGEKHVI
jgi:metallo-beta-lactamase family protein